jgi:hypothetical protein
MVNITRIKLKVTMDKEAGYTWYENLKIWKQAPTQDMITGSQDMTTCSKDIVTAP